MTSEQVQERVVAFLERAGGRVVHGEGLCTSMIAQGAGLTVSQAWVAAALKALDDDGKITREMRGRRTFEVTLKGVRPAGEVTPATHGAAGEEPARSFPPREPGSTPGPRSNGHRPRVKRPAQRRLRPVPEPVAVPVVATPPPVSLERVPITLELDELSEVVTARAFLEGVAPTVLILGALREVVDEWANDPMVRRAMKVRSEYSNDKGGGS